MLVKDLDNYAFSINTEVLVFEKWCKIHTVNFGARNMRVYGLGKRLKTIYFTNIKNVRN